MSRIAISNFRFVLAMLIAAGLAQAVSAETLYVDGIAGDDGNPGTKDRPLKTICRAAQIVNDSNAPGPTTIKIGPGVYDLSKQVLFKNNRVYTEKDRLTIEAMILPNEPNWGPVFMPVILSSEFVDFREEVNPTISLKVEVSHVTVRGLKFLGNPRPRSCHYAIWRNGKDLEDLIVTQCLFVGDEYALPLNCCICANGEGAILDHDVFYHCGIPAVFWNAKDGESNGNAMRYCIVEGAGISAVWTCQTGEDFEFHHNIVTDGEYFWRRIPKNRKKYQVRDCIISGNKYYSGYGTKDALSGQTGAEITFSEENVVKSGKVILEKYTINPDGFSDDMPRNFLHVKPGTFGSELGAGLFKKTEKGK